jgi:hypothetical protein
MFAKPVRKRDARRRLRVRRHLVFTNLPDTVINCDWHPAAVLDLLVTDDAPNGLTCKGQQLAGLKLQCQTRGAAAYALLCVAAQGVWVPVPFWWWTIATAARSVSPEPAEKA